MNQKIKDYIGIVTIIVLITFALSSVSFALSYSRSLGPLSLRSFTVDGEGIVAAVPDIGQFSASVITNGGLNVDELQNQNTQKSNSVIDFLKSSGVDEKDIETSRYSISPRYDYPRCEFGFDCPPPEISGYNISQSIIIKVRDLDNAGILLSGVVRNGANSVSGLSFTIDDPVKLENDARKEAILQAEDKAKSIADAGGFKLGKLLSIETINPQSPVYYARGLTNSVADEAAPNIEPGSEDIISRVILTYEIR